MYVYIYVAETYANGNAKSKTFFVQTCCFQRTAENFLVPLLWEKREKMLDFFFFFPNGFRRRKMFFLVASCQHAGRNQLVRRSTLDLNIFSAHRQPARCPVRPTNIDDGLEDIRWIHGLGGDARTHRETTRLPQRMRFEARLLLYRVAVSTDRESLKRDCLQSSEGKMWVSTALRGLARRNEIPWNRPSSRATLDARSTRRGARPGPKRTP